MTPITPRRLTRRTLTFALAGAATAAAATTVAPGSRAAQDATPADGTEPPLVPAGATVVAGGLVNPRHLAIDGDGTIYVTEVGTGGGEVTPRSPRGYSGRISRIAPDGTTDVLVPGLVSYAEGVGAAGIALVDGALWFTLGGVGVDGGFEPLPEEATLNRFDPGTGTVTPVAELGTYEVANNPDGADVSTNPYGIAPHPDGSLLVADAGANVLHRVDPGSGRFELVGVIPGLPRITGREPAEGERQRQSVPTSVAVNGAGLIHVSLLSQNWPLDAPSIVVIDDGTFTPVLLGGSMIVSIAFGPDGSLYFSQLIDAGGDSRIGSVRRVLDDRTPEPVIEGLTLPHGIAFDDAGNLFVATNALLSTPEATLGQLLRFDNVAAPA
jgi:sugar lactone lactonase YvrE